MASLSHRAHVETRCDQCGQPATTADPLHPWDWPGRPDGSSCIGGARKRGLTSTGTVNDLQRAAAMVRGLCPDADQ
jgi:hypothetical protein